QGVCEHSTIEANYEESDEDADYYSNKARNFNIIAIIFFYYIEELKKLTALQVLSKKSLDHFQISLKLLVQPLLLAICSIHLLPYSKKIIDLILQLLTNKDIVMQWTEPYGTPRITFSQSETFFPIINNLIHCFLWKPNLQATLKGCP
ncbi:hypothetical protein BpHYR1_036861, partial [Brachionus plicatilis]